MKYKKVNRICLRCKEVVYKSDIRSYPYVCLNCDENMYSFETEKIKQGGKDE